MERYIVMRILFGLFLLLVVVFFVIRLAGGGDSVPPSFLTDEEVVLSESINNTSSVQFTVVGPTVAQEDHRVTRFIVSENRRVVQVLKGYNGTILKETSLPNTTEAYAQLVYAIDNEGFLSERTKIITDDPNGVCSNGKQYEYRLKQGASTRAFYWSTSCSTKEGTFGGDRRAINKLFEKQFPDYREFKRDLGI